MAACRYCGFDQDQGQQHYPTLCISLLQDRLEIAEQERDAAQADAKELRRVLSKFRIVISGYKRASESHLPEVDAALNNGKDPLAHLTAKKEASQ